MDDRIPPLFAHSEPGECYEIHELARFIARPGLPEVTAAERARRFARLRLIHTRHKFKSGPTASNLFGVADVAAAAALSALYDAGIADPALLGFASAALYGWQPEQAAHSQHPITHAIYGVANGDYWKFEVTVFRDVRTGERIIRAFCFNADTPPRFHKTPIGSHLVPIASVHIDLSPLLLVIVARIKTAAGGVGVKADA